MQRISNRTAGELEAALDEYFELLNESDLADKSVEDYYYFAWVFLRWLQGKATPGAHVRNGQ